jgi:hypothetical protein
MERDTFVFRFGVFGDFFLRLFSEMILLIFLWVSWGLKEVFLNIRRIIES